MMRAGGGPRGVHVLAKGGIPLIGLSSGSVAAGGAITAITALPLAYPSAYCWFPANKLAAAIAAGWYYCTFSTTTAGIAFLNTYTSGVPTIPASPTAVVAGQGAFVGDTGEEFGNTITVPANALGATGQLKVSVMTAQANNANAKTLNLRWSGNAGTIFVAQAGANQPTIGFVAAISNAGATNANVSSVPGAIAVTPATASVLGAIDSTAATTLVLSITRAVATDNLVILPPTVELLS